MRIFSRRLKARAPVCDSFCGDETYECGNRVYSRTEGSPRAVGSGERGPGMFGED